MDRRQPRRPTVLLVALCAVPACGGDPPSVLEPGSRDAERVAGLWWVLFWISVAVVAVVTAFLLLAVRRRRRFGEDVDRRPVRWGDRFVLVAGVVVPGAILAGTFLVSLAVLDAMEDRGDDPAVTVEVVAHNWWWEVRYPGGVVTANEIRLPAGEPVDLVLSSADVIHSFWVPELQVKEDHIPGTDNLLRVEANGAGRFRGQCAEFCGLQHAHMAFIVEALPPDEFAAWLEREAEPAREPDGGRALDGREIFATSSCAGCHTVRGTPAQGDVGPDLTHLAGRETIGAGLIPLTPRNLADFIADPQGAKPGVGMPPTELTDEEIDAVTAYLMELE